MIAPAAALLLTAASLTLCAQAAGPPAVLVVAHRGAKNAAPENTIAAFDAAARAGADYVELDVRTTADGELVILHDATVDRTTNGRGAVRDLTLAQVKALDAGGGQRVPTFREALLWGRDRGVRIDIDHKDASAEAIATAVRETGMVRNVVIEGSRDNLRQFAALLPGVDTMPKVTSAADAAQVCGSLKTTIVRLSAAQLEDASIVRAVHDCRARVSVTILGEKDAPNEMQRVIALGAELIETDHPDEVSAVRREMRDRIGRERRRP